jgi:hypothetical protein
MIKNPKIAQRQLDLAAEELDEQGHQDLADKVDLCSAKLTKASDEELKVIASVLRKINREVDSRNGATTPTSTSPNRLAMVRRKEALRHRMAEKKAAERLERDLMEGLDLKASSSRNDDALRMFRQKRIKEAKARIAAIRHEGMLDEDE